MAEIKWIKITTDIFDNEKIKVIEKMPEGDTMLVIWLKLLTLAGKKNDQGFVYLTQNIPYTPEILADIFGRDSRIISLALNTFASFNMICIENDIISVLNWDRYQNVEGMDKIREQNRIRQANYRQRKQLTSNVTSRDSNGADIEEDKEKIKIRKEIITYLNNVIGSKYRHTSAESKKHIDARLNEGFDLSDFKTVIIKKHKEWVNTDRAIYLRPQTLFGTKFESYLNQPEIELHSKKEESLEEKNAIGDIFMEEHRRLGRTPFDDKGITDEELKLKAREIYNQRRCG